MLCTIIKGKYSLVQGYFLRQLEDGRIAVKVGQSEFVGVPVSGGAA